MYGMDNLTAILIVLAVILFALVAVAVLIIIDHKAKIQSLTDEALGHAAIRHDHPPFSFVIMIVLSLIILALFLELAVAIGTRVGMFQEKEQPRLIKKLAEMRFTEKKRHFHNEPKENFVNLGKKPVCFYCHGDYPHFTLPMVRSILNMHTQFVGCMTCHNDPRKIDEKSLSFGWLNYSGIEVTGKPFGTLIDSATGFVAETDDYYSKIVVYASINADPELLEMTEDRPEVREFVQMRGQFTDQEREIYKKNLHKLVSPKGRFCTRCHSQENKSYLPFSKLGFSAQRVTELTNINIVGIVEKYREFYMPTLFEYKDPLPDLEDLVGKESKKQ